MSPEKFREYVDLLVELYELNPDLPELVRLKARAEEIVGSALGYPVGYLRMLNPDSLIGEHKGVPFLAEQLSGHVLKPWSLARHHCRDLDERLVKIVVDDLGAHLFADSVDNEVFLIAGAAIDPLRLADPGNRYRAARDIIRQFTGVEIDWREQIGSTRTMIVTMGPDGWQLELDRVSVVRSS